MLGNKIKKRILSVVFGLIVVSAMVISSCDAVTNGVGQAEQAALAALSASSVKVGQTVITDQDELAAIERDPSGDYVLGASFSVTNWVPICIPTSEGGVGPFTGTLDGAGYTITVESFDGTALSSSDYIGIFAQSDSGATFSNLTVNLAAPDNAAVIINTNAHYVGGLVGQAMGTNFNTITVNGSLNAQVVVIGTAPVNIGLVSGYAANGTTFETTTVKADLNVQYTNQNEGTVNSGGITGQLLNSRIRTAGIDGLFTVTADMPAAVYPAPDNYIALGGAAGYAESSDLAEVTVGNGAAVNAISKQTRVYVGGVLGRGLQVRITNAHSAAAVSGNGPGYNTSAGGVAGYIIYTTVSDSSASGSVTLTALGVNFDWNDSWQADAGGLIGYAGGSADGASSIIHSYATGDVSVSGTVLNALGVTAAYAPFPYAGGLLGYAYGYNNFSDPASNGTLVSKCYATGNVTSVSQPDPNGKVGDIPYAGGLVGYSSVVGSRIEDSYARGNVTAITEGTWAWGGGIIGGNTNDSVVIRTYATGDVTVRTGNIPPLTDSEPLYANDPGPATGGIAGFNYYSANTLVSNSVALNSLVDGNQSASQDVVHRVVGSLGKTTGFIGTLDDNLANVGMTVINNWVPHIGPNDVDGDNTSAQPAQTVFEGLGWDFDTIWTMGGDNYPALR